jgi:hypothetical protein
MDAEIRKKLRLLLAQADRDELLDDPRRLSELVRERLGSERRREAAFLIVALNEGVPKRLLAMSVPRLSGVMLDNYARRLSEDTGLREEVARTAIEAWAAGLGLEVDADPLASQPGPGPKPVAGPEPPPIPPAFTRTPANGRTNVGSAGVPADPLVRAVTEFMSRTGLTADSLVRLLGVALIAHGAIEILLQISSAIFLRESFDWTYLMKYGRFPVLPLAWCLPISFASIAIGFAALSRAQWVRGPGMILAAIGGIFYGFFCIVAASRFVEQGPLHGIIHLAGVAVMAGSFVLFYCWPLSHSTTVIPANRDEGLHRANAASPAQGVYPIEWLQERLTLADAERMLSAADAKWQALKSAMRPGDELWTFTSPADSWAHLAGRAGIALVRNRTIVSAIVTLMN